MFPNQSHGLRIKAAEAIGRKKYTAAIPSLIAALRHDSDPDVRRAVALSLASFESPEVRAALQITLEDRDARVRSAAALSLGRLRHPDSVEALMRHLRDEDPEVRATAVWALDEIEQ